SWFGVQVTDGPPAKKNIPTGFPAGIFCVLSPGGSVFLREGGVLEYAGAELLLYFLSCVGII
ncbi:MAG: hypothetical protein ACLSHC_18980, partial [Bilophila wadsworthia]